MEEEEEENNKKGEMRILTIIARNGYVEENNQKGANIGGGYEKVEGVKEKWEDEKEERKKRKNDKQN